MNDSDDKLLNNVTDALDQSVESIDAATLSKLNQARHAALEAGSGKRYRGSWLAAGMTAGIAVLAVSLWFSLPQHGLQNEDHASWIAATEALSEEDLEVIEDLEFYAWLLEQDNAG